MTASGAHRLDPSLVSVVRDLEIDQSYLRHVIDKLTSIGSSPLGFRTTGTQEDAAVAEFVSGEFQAMGLADVAIEDVEVDAWRFRSATVRTSAGGTAAGPVSIEACSFGGVPATPPVGVTGRLVDVGEPRRRRLDRHNLSGAVALVDWLKEGVEPSAVVLELARRGVIGMVLNCPSGGPWYQSPDALGAFDSHWPAGAPPMVIIRKEHASALRQILTVQGPLEVTMILEAEQEPGAAGHNVVGFMPGELPGPIVVGAHHDAWFRGAFDNTSGVAAILAIARATTRAPFKPRNTICFTSRTAEEYGISGSAFDWCIGAWRQVQVSHPDWATESPFHLCVEASGHPGLRTIVEAPVELAAWARRICRAAEGQGWTPSGWRVAEPVSGTEQWPYLVSGIPGVAAYSWERSFGMTDYHTQLDTTDLLDFDTLAAQSRLYALLLLEADRSPDAILDHRARASQLTKIAAATGHADLAAAADAHAHTSGRRAFTAIGSGLLALDAHGRVRYPHEQTAADLAALDAALSALEAHDRAEALRQLRRVGTHFLVPYLSEEALTAHNHRSRPESVTRTWAQASHLTPSPQLWQELATLSGEPDARPYGTWLPTSLEQARQSCRQQLTRRLTAMTNATRAAIQPDQPRPATAEEEE